MINSSKQLAQMWSSLVIGLIGASVTVVSGQTIAHAQTCNVFGCSAPGAGACNPFGCPAPGAAACDPFGCPAAPPSAATGGNKESRNFEISNQTGSTIKELYLSPSGHSEWGPNDLDDRIRNGSSMTFTLSSSSCLYDIRALLSNGKSQDARQVNTCELQGYKLQ